MGVPKFFRYISERYPCLSELVVDHNIPDFDNLYLDMNGIIHNCSHPNDTNVHFRISEEQIFKDIFSYIEFLFLIIKPKKLFFLAVDGVAPRAKMNQQRGRRFRSAKDAEVLEEKARKSGDVLPDEDRFDSNCITPGTEFMDRLQKALEYFIQMKISSNTVWQRCRVILSGHQTPGEGEHKIMEYIRFLKVQPNYDSDTRHCLYGLDADLIMLGLCTHERYFSLLREEVKFAKTAARVSSVNETKFFLLHLCLMREYLELEFAAIKHNTLKFKFDLEKIIDDWIFMGFLVGNDFIPHLPNLHINNNALPLLYATYMKVLPKLDGYINEEGKLNLVRFEKFMEELAEYDRDAFRQQYSDLEYFESKTTNNTDAFDTSVEDIKNSAANGFGDDLSELVKATEQMFRDDLDEDADVLPMGSMEDNEFFEQEFQQFKRNYYIAKLGYKEITPEIKAELAEEYVRALQWTLYYYYCGVQSWGWFYPHHYSPFISDIQNFKDMDFKLSLGTPFLPFQQLLSVLPSASRKSIPVAYHDLMISPDSKIKDFYPTDFQTDLNGKKQEWEAVVLIPFMEENRLLEAMKACNDNLSAYEKERNSHGPMFQYEYDSVGQGRIEGVANFPSISSALCTVTEVTRNDVFVPENKIIFGPTKNGPSVLYYPGFPTMKHLKYRAELRMKQVKVFDQPSRNDNMIIKVTEESNASANQSKADFLKSEAAALIGQTVHIHWPHLAEAKVVEIFDATQKITAKGVENVNGREFQQAVGSVRDHHMGRLGIDLGDIEHMIYVLPCIGHKYTYANFKFELQKIYSQFKVAYPLKSTVRNLKAYDGSFEPTIETEKMFSAGTSVFMLTPQYYGSFGLVTDTSMMRKTQRIKVSLCVPPEPNFSRAIEKNKDCKKYLNSYNAASSLGISNNVLSRITGSVLIIQGHNIPQVPEGTTKFNIGLQMRFVKNNEEVVGFTKKTPQSWTYSDEALDIIREYSDKYPRLFQLLSQKGQGQSMDIFFEADLFPTEMGQGKVNEMVKWIKSQPHANAERRNCGTVLLEKAIVEELIVAVEANKNNPLRQIILQVKPHLLYKANLTVSTTGPDPKANFDLFDRVTVASDSQIVPLGFKGTIIGIQRMVDLNPVRQERVRQEYVSYEILFDEEFAQGTTIYGIADKRISKISETNLINVSYGLSLSDANPNSKKGAEKPAAPVNNALQNPNKSGPVVEKNLNDSQTIALLQRLQIKPQADGKVEKSTSLNATSELENESKEGGYYENIWNELKKPNNGKSLPKPPVVLKPSAVNVETNTLKMMLGIGKQGESVTNVPIAQVAVKTEPSLNNLPQPPKNWRSNSGGEGDKQGKHEDMPLPGNPNFMAPTRQNIDPSILQAMNFQPPFPPFAAPPHPFNTNPQNMIYSPQPYNQQNSMNYFAAGPSQPQMGPPFGFNPYQSKNQQRQNFQNAPNPNRQQHQQHHRVQEEQRQKPNGPQMLNFDIANAPAHASAFVPLQAILKGNKSQNAKKQSQPTQTNQFESRNDKQRVINEAKQEKFKNNAAVSLENVDKSTNESLKKSESLKVKDTPPVTEVKVAAASTKKPPKSRLAAKFLSTDN